MADMTLPWPDGATCGMCRWWHGFYEPACPSGHGICNFAKEDDNKQAYVNYEMSELITHRDHGCRAWKPKDETA